MRAERRRHAKKANLARLRKHRAMKAHALAEMKKERRQMLRRHAQRDADMHAQFVFNESPRSAAFFADRESLKRKEAAIAKAKREEREWDERVHAASERALKKEAKRRAEAKKNKEKERAAQRKKKHVDVVQILLGARVHEGQGLEAWRMAWMWTLGCRMTTQASRRLPLKSI